MILHDLQTELQAAIEEAGIDFYCEVDDLWKQWRVVVFQKYPQLEYFTITMGVDCLRLRSLVKRDRQRDFSYALDDVKGEVTQHILFCLSDEANKPASD